MPPTRVDTLRRDDGAALDLPLKLAVLTVVGVAGLAALLSALPSCAVPAPLAAEVVSVDGKAGDLLRGSRPAQIGVRVTAQGQGVRDATVVLTGAGSAGPGTAAANRTDGQGNATLLIDPLPVWARLVAEDREEGHLKLTASAPGCYREFENLYALRLLIR
ncbi:MAG: hypothetical protein QXT68_01460 [Halobacteria archaeon]